MSDNLAGEERGLCELFVAEPRGPKRNGLFAMWLVVRVVGDMMPRSRMSDRTHRRRIEALSHRLATLTLPPRLRDALQIAIGRIGNEQPSFLPEIFNEMSPAVLGTLGSNAADYLNAIARRITELQSDQKEARPRE